MSYFGSTEYALEVARGNVPGVSPVNKFGEALDCDSGVATDIWDGADGTTSTDVWVPPTTARIHDIAGGAADTAAGTGMRTCRVYGLTSWGAAEVSEDITMNGATNVPTINAYVIIHRIKGLTFGSGGTNSTVITATAQTDATITAAIQTGEGQTLMAIYGVPSTQKLFVVRLYSDVIGGVGVDLKGKLLVMENADQSDSGFITKQKWGLRLDRDQNHEYALPKTFTGPCILKVQVTSDANNSNVTGGFDAYLIDN